ncbi:protein phosphatase 2C domain-containing protein [Streptomyces sp. T028]|uniref:protein phosphatase 2C domain-containing protein n=1 Tax=Streptomyces sp. T028 TaxID=3394379 RepID=UPI003A85604C
MSQQGGRPTGPEDDWWGQLYDDSTADTGPAPTADSLDDRFASAAGAVRTAGPADTGPADKAPADAVPSQRTEAERAAADARTDWWPADDAATATAPASPRTTVPPPRLESSPHAGPHATPGTVPDTAPAPALPPGFTHRAPVAPSAGTPASLVSGTTSTSGTAAPLTSAPPDPARTPTALDLPVLSDEPKAYVGSRPPTYDAEPTALPTADPDALDDLVADTVLDGALYGTCALRAASVRGDSARYRGEPRRDSLLTARFGTGEHALVLVAMATGARATPGAHRAAAEACRWIGRAVGRSHVRLAQDMRAARRGDLKSGLHRLTDRSLGRLRASAAEQGLEPDEYAASLRCLLLPADPDCRTRVFFGVGGGGLFRLRGGEWQDLEPRAGEIAGGPVVGFGGLPAETPEGDRLTMDLGIPTPPSPYDPPPEPPRDPFRFRASVARPGDTLLMCTSGLADPLRGEPALFAHLTERWSDQAPPGLAAFLADTQVRVKGYADDRTVAAVWEA